MGKCYLSPLGGCSSKMTLEHPFSKGLLDLVAPGGVVNYRGFPKGNGPRNNRKAGSNILCDVHNPSLSAYDAAIQAVARFLVGIGDSSNLGRGATCTIRGDHLERFLVKALAGTLAGNYKKQAPRICLDWLSSNVVPQMGQGLWVDSPRSGGKQLLVQDYGSTSLAPSAVDGTLRSWPALRPYVGFSKDLNVDLHFSGVLVEGITISIRSVPFTLSLNPITERPPGPIYRPGVLEFEDAAGGVHTLTLDWGNPAFDRVMRYTDRSGYWMGHPVSW